MDEACSSYLVANNDGSSSSSDDDYSDSATTSSSDGRSPPDLREDFYGLDRTLAADDENVQLYQKFLADDVHDSPKLCRNRTGTLNHSFAKQHGAAVVTNADLSSFTYELQQAYRIVKDLMSDTYKTVVAPFLSSVEAQVDDLHDYQEVIKKPIWLTKVREKLFRREYHSITGVVADIRLMLENCYRYHGPNSTYTKKGLRVEQILQQKLALLPRELREKTTLEATYGRPCEEAKGTRRRSAAHSLEYTSFILNQVRHERSLRDKELKKKHIEEKKAVKEVKEKQIVDWENDILLAEPLKTQLKAMWEIPQIAHFLYLGRSVLKMPEVSVYELERILIMPRASSLLPRIMTSLLSNPHQRVNLERKPAMPYKIWQNRLQGRVQYWYKILQAREYRTDLVFQQLGVEAEFFRIMGFVNPLLKKKFHELTFYQRVWTLKSLCDYVLHAHKTIQDTLNEQNLDDMRELILGSDSKGNSYLHFPQFCGQDLRIYRQSKVTSLPSPCKWGAVSKKKWKEKNAINTLSLPNDDKKETNEEESPSYPPEVKTEIEKCEPNAETSPSAKATESPPVVQNCEDQLNVEEIRAPSSTGTPQIANTKKRKRSKSPKRTQSPSSLSTSSTSAQSTRRSLRISKPKVETEVVPHKNNLSEDESADCCDEDSDADVNSSGPDIGKFELVVDSIETLRQLYEHFKAKVKALECSGGSGRSRKGKHLTPKLKSEAKLCTRLENLLTELEPWEVKLQKVTQRLRIKLKREYEDFVDLDEVGDDDIWGSDGESESSKAGSVEYSQSENGGEEFRMKENESNCFGDLSDDSQLLEDFDAMEHRTRGRLRQWRNLKRSTPGDVADHHHSKKLADGGVHLNGARRCNLEMLQSYSKQNTTSQAKELYAWETLRQILVPSSGSSVDNRSVVQTTTLGKVRVHRPLGRFSPIGVASPERKSLTKAEMDILGAIQAATLLVKKQESSGVKNDVKCSSHSLSNALQLAQVANSNNNNNKVVVVRPSVVSSQPSPARPPPALVQRCVLTDASSQVSGGELPVKRPVITRQQLSELSSIAESTENVRDLVTKAEHPATSKVSPFSATQVTSSSFSAPHLATRKLLALKNQDGTLVYYQLSPPPPPPPPTPALQTANRCVVATAPSSNHMNTSTEVSETTTTTPTATEHVTTAAAVASPRPVSGEKTSAEQQQQLLLVPVSTQDGQTVYLQLPTRSTVAKQQTEANRTTTSSVAVGDSMSKASASGKRFFTSPLREVTRSIGKAASVNMVLKKPSQPPPPLPSLEPISSSSLKPNARNVVRRKVCYLPTATDSPKVSAEVRSAVPSSEVVASRGTTTATTQSNVTVGGVSLNALLASNPALLSTIQKLAVTGHKVVLSQQGGNLVLHATPTANADARPPDAACRQSVVLQQPCPASTPTRAVPSLVNASRTPVSSSAVCGQQDPQRTAKVLVDGAAGEGSGGNVPSVPSQQQHQTTLKSKLVMIHDSASDKQILGLLLDSGQVVPLNATVSFNNNNNASGNL